ncbi:MAG TPA: hypothetical protein VNU45_15145 [Rummeliibacillus sp.]|nr:hypothetical protein [Rummeliibacillus sp.]
MMKLVDNLADAIYDSIKCLLRSFAYLMTGFILVSIPIYIFVWLMKFFT